MSSAVKVSIVIAILSFAQLVFGPPAFGQRFGGRGGRDDNRPMSSDDIAQRLTRTSDFLKGIDTNHNGVIDADEAADPQAKNMLDRIFGRMGKEPHFPMAISEILQNYEAYYRTRASGGSPGPGGSPPGGAPPAAGWSSPPGMGFGATVAPAAGATPATPSGGLPNASDGADGSRRDRDHRDVGPPFRRSAGFAGPRRPVGSRGAHRTPVKRTPVKRPVRNRALINRALINRARAGRFVASGYQIRAAQAGPVQDGPRTFARRAARLVPGEGRKW